MSQPTRMKIAPRVRNVASLRAVNRCSGTTGAGLQCRNGGTYECPRCHVFRCSNHVAWRTDNYGGAACPVGCEDVPSVVVYGPDGGVMR